jgi:putative membrane protein
MQVGGNVVRARLLARRGVSGVDAAASVVVDVTTIMVSQVLFAVLGFALLVWRLGRDTPAVPVAAGLALFGATAGGFYLAQRRGLFGRIAGGLERVVRTGEWLSSSGVALDAAVQALYRRRRATSCTVVWHLASWLVGAVELWVALRFLGRPAGLAVALLIESLGQLVRSSAFAVPGALGVQEAGYLALGRAVALDPEAALALSLAQRVRDLLLGLPGLVAWWWMEDAAPWRRAEPLAEGSE